MSVKRVGKYTKAESSGRNSSIHTSASAIDEDRNENEVKRPTEKETDVVYVSKSNAKKVKVELEALGYLDKSFKMIPVPNDKSLIALPVTDECLSYLQGTNDDQVEHPFRRMILNVGTETVPPSSSAIGKSRQKRR
jgi:hypothetical protein